MEPGNDPQLRRLLREWSVPNAPISLDVRELGRPKPWWRHLMSARIRVPLPVAVAVSVLLVWLAVLTAVDRLRPVEPAGTIDDLRGFQPVSSVNVRVERSTDASR